MQLPFDVGMFCSLCLFGNKINSMSSLYIFKWPTLITDIIQHVKLPTCTDCSFTKNEHVGERYHMPVCLVIEFTFIKIERQAYQVTKLLGKDTICFTRLVGRWSVLL